MLRISTKGRYGTRFMLELALNYGKGTVLLKDIAKNQEISMGYLEQIVPNLKAAGLINVSRGAHGGYKLARPPQEINLKDIVIALEGSLSLIECIRFPKTCDKADLCVARDLWGELSEKIDMTLESKTLYELTQKHNNKKKSQPLMYII
jgi:Rrf2 family protein